MLRRYGTRVFAGTRNYQETTRRLGIDRRTVTEKIDRALLKQLTGADGRVTGRGVASIPLEDDKGMLTRGAGETTL